MANDTIIKVENLSKLYHLGRLQQRHDTLRDWLAAGVRAPLQRLSALVHRPFAKGEASPTNSDETIWALKEVSFEVQRGEVVGIIGRNGAGKSTLLKILSRITEPTSGRAVIRGRVGSLLEVGTGFHPELTGRENIYLNGAILGMHKVEIEKKFDEIVDFAEIEKFLDTPVKRYSSGMYVRLAFAVAAHLEPEILLVDEVLAVGDVEFQKKCLGKMGDIAHGGRTVLFVSHNMGAITNLCSRAILIDKGRLAFTGSSTDVVSNYLKNAIDKNSDEVILHNPSSQAYFTRIAVLDYTNLPAQNIPISSKITIVFEYEVLSKLIGLDLSYSIFAHNGSKVFHSSLSDDQTIPTHTHTPGHYLSRVFIPKYFLAPGHYTITIGLHQPNIRSFDHYDNITGFTIIEDGSKDYKYAGQDIGSILVDFPWEFVKVNTKT
jgi:lipopolysaccharide transport system ATP-binding protein